jgi:hypothetical protein
MEIQVPLSHFLDYLKSTKEKGRKFPHLNEVEWLLRNFRCDDQVAQYEPEPLPPLSAGHPSLSSWQTICDPPSRWLGNMEERTSSHASTNPPRRHRR